MQGQPRSSLVVVGHRLPDPLPERRPVVRLDHMGEFMHDHVIDDPWRQRHHAPVEVQSPDAARAPAVAKVADLDWSRRHADALDEPFQRLEYELTPDAIDLGLDAALPPVIELQSQIGEFGRGERTQAITSHVSVSIEPSGPGLAEAVPA